MTSPNVAPQVYRLPSLQLVVFAIINSLAIYLFAVLHPLSKSVEFGTTMPITVLHGWIVLQSALLVTPAVLAGFLISRFHTRLGALTGMIGVGFTALAFVLDVIAFNAFSERLFSSTTLKVVFVLFPGLVSNLNLAMIIAGVLSAFATVVYFSMAFYGSAAIASQIVSDQRQSPRGQVIAMSVVLLTATAAVPLWRASSTINEMRASSDRHPLCLTGMVGHLNQGAAAPSGIFAVAGTVRALGASEPIGKVESEYSLLSIDSLPQNPPDILLIVIESFRREVINSHTAPNLTNLASRGIWARNHFSSSNATNMGMFSALYGLESVWFDRGLRWKPALNELFTQAKYRLGFFGGSEHWEMFQMDAFISPDLYDEFHITPVRWTESDLSMRDKAIEFFSSKEPDQKPRQPRLAVLYLYSTHFDYHSEAVDQLNQPAAKGELTSAYGPASKDEIWNRYLNSVRFIDRILGPLLTPDRIVAVIGDHGESFLEDECRLHGIRISEFQNATPAIIAGPGISSHQITQLTSHTDLLPTLLDAAGIIVNGATVLEGQSMLDPDLPSDRLMVTRNYMKPELAILGNWTGKNDKLWGHRVYFSIDQWQASPANPIDRFGMEILLPQNADAVSTVDAFDKWLGHRFGPEMATERVDLVPDLQRHMKSPQRDVAIEALRLSLELEASSFDRLIASVSDATSSNDDEVRRTAQTVWLEMHRRIKHLEMTRPKK